ncbi:nucleosome assembly protein-like protein,putative [Trypanosoma brucei gambiense DAL972]|uniref:Nucleosome assembly protein-like protein,putative n=1 Tax=Trypanosoma brucei gambiense (strain MHOM/CI/86/DAL972) TaxID=679716 RepID=C9ZXT4_TRYB9|nr:nucleosome assembly protein-like protein,putative [Trypanosoma brucei gambiense DAL972]CBH14229.1 nucleosome assembly protein-like protein,putative [Trypanosoma brucei gambiense DAL972]|eukprot:XP_011776499.1 nucleosome assembly protein-like protein,putative [Trypanosoma brucei gambiense DAL972]
MPRENFSPKHVDPVNFHNDDDEDEEEFDLLKVMNDMKVHERRNVYALKGLLNEYKSVRAKFREELSRLEVEHLRDAQHFHDIRAAIVCGTRDITDEEIAAAQASLAAETTSSGVRAISSSDEEPDTGDAKRDENKAGKKSVRVVSPQEDPGRLEKAAAAPDGGIPDFWLTAMCNAEVLDSTITERDRPALSHLQDIQLEHIDGDPHKGVRINFHFSPNEYFTNEVLSKTYRMAFDEDSGEVEIDSMSATPVDWKSREKNLTVILKKKKQRHKTKREIRVVTREEKCPSFFNFFTNPLGGEDEDEDGDGKEDEKRDEKEKGKKTDDDDDDDDDDEEETAELHIELGQVLMEELVPKAAFYYTGKSVEETALALIKKFSVESDDEDGDEDDDSDDGSDIGGKSSKKPAPSGGKTNQPECQQQ